MISSDVIRMSSPHSSIQVFQLALFIYLFIFTYGTIMPVGKHNGTLAYGKEEEANFNLNLSRLNNDCKTGLKP